VLRKFKYRIIEEIFKDEPELGYLKILSDLKPNKKTAIQDTFDIHLYVWLEHLENYVIQLERLNRFLAENKIPAPVHQDEISTTLYNFLLNKENYYVCINKQITQFKNMVTQYFTLYHEVKKTQPHLVVKFSQFNQHLNELTQFLINHER
jgi:hypothetical protein